MKFLIGFVFILLFGSTYGQRSLYNHCSGAVFVPVNGSFSLNFLGDKKENHIWVVFIAPKTGKIKLNLAQNGSPSKPINGYYWTSNSTICEATKMSDSISFLVSNTRELEITIEKNQSACICLTGAPGIKDEVIFNCSFSALNNQEEEHVLNLIYDKSLPNYTILIRDEATLSPIAGRIFLQGSPEISGSYFASKLQLNLKQPIKKGSIKIDAPGYFPVEFKEHAIPLGSQRVDTILLHEFEAGEITKLEQVYFSAGLPEIMEESYVQLNRLRDLMLLNPGISIEIHGHVNLDEQSAKKAQQLSKQRALMVKKYLVQNGIAPERLFPIGFGSSKPIYANPLDEEQKEANRRVEILIKKINN